MHRLAYTLYFHFHFQNAIMLKKIHFKKANIRTLPNLPARKVNSTQSPMFRCRPLHFLNLEPRLCIASRQQLCLGQIQAHFCGIGCTFVSSINISIPGCPYFVAKKS